jgi:glutathione synthase/RimK-type ligase-like ATP-grasp enzyme
MRRRVIAWGLSGDPSFDAVCRELVRTRTPHAVVDQRFDTRAEFDDAGAFFARPYSAAALHDQILWGVDDAARRNAQLAQYALFAQLEIADVLVANRPSAAATNSSRPYQAERMRAHGFAVPETLVTTSPDDARAFIERHGEVIYKSVGDVRSAGTRVAVGSEPRLGDIASAPTQFQACISGVDWRVHVVGDDVFACEIRAFEIRAARLPAAVAARCHALAHALGLPLAGIDLRRTDEGEWYGYEVNAAPTFAYYERETRQPLTTAVVALLAAAASATGELAA